MIESKTFTYTWRWKLPSRILALLGGIIAPIFMLILLISIIAEGGDIGTILEIVVFIPIFISITLFVFSLFPEIEVNYNKFRISTGIMSSNWILIEEIIQISQWGAIKKVDVIEVKGLPKIYSFIRIPYGRKYPCFFIHSRIKGYSDLLSLLKRDLD